jgi:hypothetical protein
MIKEAKGKDEPITVEDIEQLCRELAEKGTKLHKMLMTHHNIDADVLKNVKKSANYYQYILPIDDHLRKKRAEKRNRKMVDEDVTVSAQSPTNVQQAAKKLAGTDSNVVVTEKHTIRLKDVLSESVLNGFRKKIGK